MKKDSYLSNQLFHVCFFRCLFQSKTLFRLLQFFKFRQRLALKLLHARAFLWVCNMTIWQCSLFSNRSTIFTDINIDAKALG